MTNNTRKKWTPAKITAGDDDRQNKPIFDADQEPPPLPGEVDPRPPEHIREAAHRVLGELLHELQRLYDLGQMKCLAGV